MTKRATAEIVLKELLDDHVRFKSINGRHDMGAGDSIQDCLDANGPGAHIRITDEYDLSVESLPVSVEHTGVEIRGSAGGAGGEATVYNSSGADFLHLNQSNNRNPGVTLRDMKIVQSAGGSAIHCQDSKHNYFENVHADGNRIGDDDLWYFGGAASDHANNTQRLVGCSAEEAGRDGFRFGNLTHHVAMYGCAALWNRRMGIYVEGPYSFSMLTGQLEDNGEAGLRARVADDIRVGGNTYVEGNARAGNLGDAEIVLVSTANAVINQAWANAKSGGTAHVVQLRNSGSGSVQNLHTDAGYDALVYTDSVDTELHRATHLVPEGVRHVEIGAGAQRVRDRGTIIGAGVGQGGSGEMDGVDLESVTGQFPFDEAVSNGERGAVGESARWLSAERAWQLSDGSATISPE